MIQIKSESDIDIEKWKNLVHSSNVASFFQTKECYDFYCTNSFLEAFLFGVEEDSVLKGVICGYIIKEGGFVKSFFSRRAIIQGGPLLANDISEEALETLLEHTKKELSKKTIYVEIRNNNSFDLFKTTFEKLGFNYNVHLNYIVNTGNRENIIESLSKSKRRQVRKADNSGLKVIRTEDMQDVHNFYSLLKKLYDEKIKKPLFPVEFFENLVNIPNGHLFVTKFEDRIIGGMACVSLNNKVLYEWFVCGDYEGYNHLYPSVAVTHYALQYAVQNNYDKFDFMGAGKPYATYGVREFKSKFGSELVENGRFLYVFNKFYYSVGKIGLKIISIF